MKISTLVFSLFLFTLFSQPRTWAADCGGKCFLETEIIADYYGHSFSQYFIYSTERWSLLARGYAVQPDLLRHGEFEFGPTVHFGLGCLQVGSLNTVGFTTDGSFTTGHTFDFDLCGNRFTYTADPKWYFWNKRMTDELFQKIITQDIFSTQMAAISFYAENLMADFTDPVFLRVGPRIKIAPGFFSHILGEGGSLAFTPFYDIQQNTGGGMITLTIVK